MAFCDASGPTLTRPPPAIKKEVQLSLHLFRFEQRAANFNFAYRGGGPIWKPGW
jgi:hypothetical protein